MAAAGGPAYRGYGIHPFGAQGRLTACAGQCPATFDPVSGRAFTAQRPIRRLGHKAGGRLADASLLYCRTCDSGRFEWATWDWAFRWPVRAHGDDLRTRPGQRAPRSSVQGVWWRMRLVSGSVARAVVAARLASSRRASSEGVPGSAV